MSICFRVVEIPRVFCSPLPIPLGESPEVEVLVMSHMYKNNLLNLFLFRVDRAVASPLCICGSDEQTAIHLLSSCDLVDMDLKCNSSRSMVDLAAEQCSTILNCSRDYMFVNLCIGIVESQGLNLRRKIKRCSKAILDYVYLTTNIFNFDIVVISWI